MSLASLLKKGGLPGRATAIPATFATDAPLQLPTVAKVAKVAVANPPGVASKDNAQPLDREAWPERAAIVEYDGGLTRQDAEALADSCCWPHSSAMNGAEIDTFTARLARFTDKGLSLIDAESLADKLVIRDREGDDRRACLECAHLRHGGRCGNWKASEVASNAMDARLPGDFTTMLQRCGGFAEGTR